MSDRHMLQAGTNFNWKDVTNEVTLLGDRRLCTWLLGQKRSCCNCSDDGKRGCDAQLTLRVLFLLAEHVNKGTDY
eukprot:m.271552 g.271552  ORF g.271552 m.271552 type:complete len:75 (+) comp15683_c5_seq1:93-317(+)